MPRAINGSALREIRSLAGLTGRELARRSGLSPTTVSNIENGKHGVSPDVMVRLAAACKVPVDAISSPAPEAASA